MRGHGESPRELATHKRYPRAPIACHVYRVPERVRVVAIQQHTFPIDSHKLNYNGR